MSTPAATAPPRRPCSYCEGRGRRVVTLRSPAALSNGVASWPCQPCNGTGTT